MGRYLKHSFVLTKVCFYLVSMRVDLCFMMVVDEVPEKALCLAEHHKRKDGKVGDVPPSEVDRP